MPNYEVKATIKIVGWDNVTAESEDEAIEYIENKLDELFTFNAPLLNKYSQVFVEIDKGLEND